MPGHDSRGGLPQSAQKQHINDLNVFPVPDGDTGTNMCMTIGTAVTELRKSEPATVEQAASVTASALLRGARGNSGVILSLLFRGLSKALKGRETADAATFAAAMQEGVSAAYKAVMKPAEGTILTVSRLTAARAADAAARPQRPGGRAGGRHREGQLALEHTTEMNPVLKKAGVVDAGGKGYLLILQGMLADCGASPCPRRTARRARRRRRPTSPPWRRRTSPSPSTRCSSSARPSPHLPGGLCRPISTASATVWSSARTTRPSRSTSTPTFPALP